VQPFADPRGGGERCDGRGARASHRGCRGRATRGGRSHARRPRAPWLMRAQDCSLTGARVLPTSARRHRHLTVPPGPIPRRHQAQRAQGDGGWATAMHSVGVDPVSTSARRPLWRNHTAEGAWASAPRRRVTPSSAPRPPPRYLSGTGVRGVWGGALQGEEDFLHVSSSNGEERSVSVVPCSQRP
jgi:hypothetical protein